MSASNKISTPPDAGEKTSAWKEQGLKWVFTNGCFDILHSGHVRFLEEAKGLGDKLLVAINTDASVRKLKGPDRPVIREDERAYLLAALECVDLVVFFDTDTPLELIGSLKPDILVKGGDYRPETIVGYDLVKGSGGKVLSLSFYEGISTTGVIQRILKGNSK